METSVWQQVKWLVVGVRLDWEGWCRDGGDGYTEATSASGALDGCGAGEAGTGFSLWATRSSSVARGKGWVSNSAESRLGALWVELGVFELGPHSNYGPPGQTYFPL